MSMQATHTPPLLRPLLALTLLLASTAAAAPGGAPADTPHETLDPVAYRADLGDAYADEKCVLHIHRPVTDEPFRTVVWFHAGGLRGGEPSLPGGLLNQGIAVVSAGYRLHPRVTAPAYIEDAAAAVAWTLENVERLGGDPEHVYVSGHSAGGYLAMMVGLDDRWLAAHGRSPAELAGLIPYSGHTITHFTVREERGIPGTRPVVDDLAPLFHVRPDAPPLVLITGARDWELFGRYEETAYMWRMMNNAGHEQTELYEIEGFGHGDMVQPAHHLLLKVVRR